MIEYCSLVFLEVLRAGGSQKVSPASSLLKKFNGLVSQIYDGESYQELALKKVMTQEVLRFSKKFVQQAAQGFAETPVQEEIVHLERIYYSALQVFSEVFAEATLFADQVQEFKGMFNKSVWATFVSRLGKQGSFLSDSLRERRDQFFRVFGALSSEIDYDFQGFSEIFFNGLKAFGRELLDDKELVQPFVVSGLQIEEEGQGVLEAGMIRVWDSRLVHEVAFFLRFVNEVVQKFCNNHPNMRRTKIKFFEHFMNYKGAHSAVLERGLHSAVENLYFLAARLLAQEQTLPDPESRIPNSQEMNAFLVSSGDS